MINSKLITVLSALQKEEMLRFIDFVKSPYFNKKKHLNLFCEVLAEIHPNFEQDNVDKKAIYNKIFPGEGYDEKQLGYMQSDLTKLALSFMGNLTKEDKPPNIPLVKALAERKLHQLYNKESNKFETALGKSVNKGANHYKLGFEFYDIKDQYFIAQNERKDDVSAHLASENLDLYFISRKLQYYTVLLNRKTIIGNKIAIPNMDFVLNYAKIYFDTNPIINAYYEVIMMQTEDDPLSHFNKLKEIIALHADKFSPKETAEIYEEAINYCIQRISHNKEFYTDEALHLYMQFLDSGYMYQNGKLSHWKFKNIIKLGLMLNRFEFVEQFILDYQDRLEKKHKAKALNYNYAELYFTMKNYNTAQDHLRIVFSHDLELAYNLGSRMMLIKIFYHNNDIDALLSQIAAFTIFLKRAKNISPTKKKIYLNFCDILNKIMRQNLKHYEKIETEIKDTKLITASSWLLQVYNEMKPLPLKKQATNKLHGII